MKTYHMLIGGEWVSSRSKATREIIDPGNGEVLAAVPESSRQDVRLAVDCAREAFDRGPWRKTAALERGKMLFKIADLIRAEARGLAELESSNCGKPLAEAEFDVGDAANCFEFYGGLATKIHGETMRCRPTPLSFVVSEPVGVCGQIIPWNFRCSWRLGNWLPRWRQAIRRF